MRKGFAGLFMVFVLGFISLIFIYIGLTKQKTLPQQPEAQHESEVPAPLTINPTTQLKPGSPTLSPSSSPSSQSSTSSTATPTVIQYTLTPARSTTSYTPTPIIQNTSSPTSTTKGKGNGGGTGIVTGG